MSDKKFYEPSLLVDKSLKRKSVILDKSLQFINDIPIFSIIEFNLINKCNRVCDFCPVSEKDFYMITGINKKLDITLYNKIIEELKSVSYQGKILFSGFSEPMLHKSINDFVKIAVEKIPGVRVEIVTNGDVFLNKSGSDILEKLFDVGLSAISISLYDGPHQVEYFQKLKRRGKYNDNQVILRRRYLENGNYGMVISNRGGLVQSNKYRDENDKPVLNNKLPLNKPCYYPFYMMKIDSNGDVLICSHDWRKQRVLGNLNSESIMNIWHGDELFFVRSNLTKNNRNIEPCNICDVHGDIIGKENYDAWVDSQL